MQVVAIDSLGRENVSDRVAASGLDRKAAEARARELNALYGDACHGACSRAFASPSLTITGRISFDRERSMIV